MSDRLYDMGQISRAAEIERLRARLAECEAECLEQARLNGMGSEREARLQARLAEAMSLLEYARLQGADCVFLERLKDITDSAPAPACSKWEKP